MRRHVLSRLDDLDRDARALAAAAARRAGLSLEEWAAAVLDPQDEPALRPRPPQRRAGSDLDALIARMSPASRPEPTRDYEALMAAIAAESERQAQDQTARTAIALESMASWIEQAETRLDEAARASADQQDRIAAILSQALSSLKERLDTVERRVASEQAPPPRIEFPTEEALRALAPVSETLSGLRADMTRLAARLEQPAPDVSPAVETIRAEIDTLRSGMEHLATRRDIAALGTSLGSIARDLGQGPTGKDLHSLAGSMSVVYEQVQTLSEQVNHELHQHLGLGIDRIAEKIDRMAGTGVDRTVIDFLSGQIVDLRHDLASRAEPEQMARLSGEIETLSRQIAEMRLHQVGKGDLTALKRSLDDVCSALYVTATAQDTSKVPELLESVDRRLDLLVRRPEPKPADLAPIGEQLALLTERMAALSGSRSPEGEASSGMEERLSVQIRALAERETLSHEPLLQRFDRIEQELRQLDRRAEPAGVAQMLRTIEEKLDRPAAPPAGLDALERQVAALAERLGSVPGEPLHKALEAAAGIAERAARAALNDIRPALPDAGDLDALKHGFVELKALHTRSDRKTQETLRSVHEALEALASRLPGQAATGAAPLPLPASEQPPSELPPADRLEAAVRKLHAVTLSRVEDTTLNIPNAPVHDPKPAEATPIAAADEDAGLVRASFIAAARRAAQNAGPETAEPSLVQEAGLTGEKDDGEAGTVAPQPSLFERLRRTFDNHSRPLLLGLAFLVLAAGTAQILSGGPGAPSGASAGAAQLVQAPEPEAPDTPAAPAAKQEWSLFQTSSLAAQPSSQASLGPALPAAGRFLVDPATIGAIPDEVPAGLRQAALSGDAAALYEIGARLTEGRGVAEDLPTAIRLFERASQAGLPPAQERLARMFEKGLGGGRDLKQAVFWYERAAMGGHVRAMHNLATLVASGAAGKPDYGAALRWYSEAAEAGFRDSQFNTGLLLTRGIGAKPNLPKAFQWFSLAAAQGDAQAARKRDELAARLSPAELENAKAAVDRWRPRAVDPVANEAPATAPEWTAALDRSSPDRS
ncbi:SEL1-like repeat protein [Microvirga splendida]|uniref:SEL1-like repeat protein n=1 Tax=Microvirga splendida TaxID=2795727 RepID=A0ABS0XWW0_9HYPH|nr:SEL1-like repeat protein [Microvirga splendida]MBJ6124541.1 SEL1-like repeat protein [Microvirga splendida]